MAAKAWDPLEGVSAKTTKDDLMARLRKAATALRKEDRTRKSGLQEIEERLKAKGQVPRDNLRQVIASATISEWNETIQFLEELEAYLPVGLQRLLMGGKVLLEQDS